MTQSSEEQEPIRNERDSWRIDRLQDDTKDIKAVNQDHEARLRAIESFRDVTVQNLVVVFDRLDEIQEADKWIKRLITGALVTGVIGAVFTLIIWLIQNQ